MEKHTMPAFDDVYQFLARHPVVASRSAFNVHKILMRFAPGVDHYTQRVADLGLTGHDIVLDAGCGYGQWSLALARKNSQVVALDLGDKFLTVARPLLEGYGQGRTILVKGSVESIPLPDASVDAILCAEVLYYTDDAQTLAEFFRVLKRGGRLYILTAGLGYHLEYVVKMHSFISLFQPWSSYIGRTVLYKWLSLGGRSPVAFETGRELVRLLKEAGFDVQGCGPEGSLLNESALPPLRLGRYLGVLCWFEAVGDKKSTVSQKRSLAQRSVQQPTLVDALVGGMLLMLLAPYLLLLAAIREWLDAHRQKAPLIPTVQTQTFLYGNLEGD